MQDAVEAAASFALVLIGFILVLAMAYGVTRILGKRYQGANSASGYVQILDRVAISQDRAIYIIKVAGKILLVGSSPQSIQLLCELEEDALEANKSQMPTEPFADILNRMKAWNGKGDKGNGN